jgi:hypothetical protein
MCLDPIHQARAAMAPCPPSGDVWNSKTSRVWLYAPSSGPTPQASRGAFGRARVLEVPARPDSRLLAFPPLTDRRLMMPYLLGSGGSCTGHYGHDSIMRCGSDDRATPTRTALRTTVWSHKNQWTAGGWRRGQRIHSPISFLHNMLCCLCEGLGGTLETLIYVELLSKKECRVTL